MVSGVLAATLLVVPLPGGESAEATGGSSTTVVRGTAFPEPLTAQLSFAGCASMLGLVAESPQPLVGTGTVAPPAGERSLGFDLVGGNAAGALFMRPSMAQTTTADVQVYAEGGARGVAYAAYQEPADAGSVRVWVGRADLVARTSGWQRVDATGLLYAWTKRDLQTGAQLAAGPAAVIGVPSFVAAHGGDGSGFYSLGFGCDGRPFSLDEFRVGASGAVRTFDLEGLATTTTIAASRDAVTAGGTVRLTGSVRDQSGARVTDATLALEQRVGAGPWKPVFRDADAARPSDPVVVAAGAVDPQVEVTPAATTSYRFRFADRPLAEGSDSAAVTVTVGADTPGAEESEDPTDGPSAKPSPAQQAPAVPATEPTPTQEPTQEPSQEPSPAPSEDPTPHGQPGEQPSEQPGEQPSQQPVPDHASSASTKPEQPAADQPAAEGTSGP
jgi:hypothetical protein